VKNPKKLFGKEHWDLAASRKTKSLCQGTTGAKGSREKNEKKEKRRRAAKMAKTAYLLKRGDEDTTKNLRGGEDRGIFVNRLLRSSLVQLRGFKRSEDATV